MFVQNHEKSTNHEKSGAQMTVNLTVGFFFFFFFFSIYPDSLEKGKERKNFTKGVR